MAALVDAAARRRIEILVAQSAARLREARQAREAFLACRLARQQYRPAVAAVDDPHRAAIRFVNAVAFGFACRLDGGDDDMNVDYEMDQDTKDDADDYRR
jgi:hypothetical protein